MPDILPLRTLTIIEVSPFLNDPWRSLFTPLFPRLKGAFTADDSPIWISSTMSPDLNLFRFHSSFLELSAVTHSIASTFVADDGNPPSEDDDELEEFRFRSIYSLVVDLKITQRQQQCLRSENRIGQCRYIEYFKWIIRFWHFLRGTGVLQTN